MTTDMREVNSSMIHSIGFVPTTSHQGKLLVRMRQNGALYQYDGVTLNTYERLRDAHSHGRFFLKEIKDKFETTKL